MKPLTTQQTLDFAHLLDTEYVDVTHMKARLAKPEILKEGGEDDPQVFRYAEIEIYARNLKDVLREYAEITLEKEGTIQELKLYVTNPRSRDNLYSMKIHPKMREITVEIGIPDTVLVPLLALGRKHDVSKIEIFKFRH